MRRLSKILLAAGALLTGLFAPVAAMAQTAFTTDAVNLRAGPGPYYELIATLPPGTGVHVEGCDAGWCRVIYRGLSGYVSEDYIDEAAQPPPDRWDPPRPRPPGGWDRPPLRPGPGERPPIMRPPGGDRPPVMRPQGGDRPPVMRPPGGERPPVMRPPGGGGGPAIQRPNVQRPPAAPRPGRGPGDPGGR